MSQCRARRGPAAPRAYFCGGFNGVRIERASSYVIVAARDAVHSGHARTVSALFLAVAQPSELPVLRNITKRRAGYFGLRICVRRCLSVENAPLEIEFRIERRLSSVPPAALTLRAILTRRPRSCTEASP